MPTFPIPDGFQLPEGKLEGETFDQVATFKVEDGQITMSAMGGIPIEGYEQEEETEEVEEDGEVEETETEEIEEGATPGERFMKKFDKGTRKAVY
jgi:hypothetical protein